MKNNPDDPDWQQRDRCIWLAGHKAPALYVALAAAGYCKMKDVITGLRKLDSSYEGHPHWLKLSGVEVSTGSLGQGLSIANGMALAARLDKKDIRIYCVMGDGELNEGQIWEAAMTAAHYNLDKLCGIVDFNKIQIDGWCSDVMNMEPLAEKWKSFGWHVIECDGHDFEELIGALDEAEKTKGKPTIILAHTIKGKGVSFIENQAKWHGIAPKKDELERALKELDEE